MATRARVAKLFPIALSPQGVADALDCPLEIITKAIKSGELPCYARGKMRRIPVLSVVAWIEKFWITIESQGGPRHAHHR